VTFRSTWSFTLGDVLGVQSEPAIFFAKGALAGDSCGCNFDVGRAVSIGGFRRVEIAGD